MCIDIAHIIWMFIHIRNEYQINDDVKELEQTIKTEEMRIWTDCKERIAQSEYARKLC